MAARKNAPPPACLDCQHLLAELAKVQRQQRKQAADMLEAYRLMSLKHTQLEDAQKQLLAARKWMGNATIALGETARKHWIETTRQRREILNLRQLLQAHTVAMPQMPMGTLTIYPN